MAKLADEHVEGGYSDWYLPSRDELYAMRTALADTVEERALHGFTDLSLNHSYLSSSEYSATHVYGLIMGSGSTANYTKSGSAKYCRGVHTIPEPATMALMALGGIGMLLRRKRRK